MNSRSVKGSVVLVTGAASGMGRATAEVFAAEGAHVACTDIAAESVREVADDLTHRGFSAEAWTLDVSDPASIDLVTAAVAARFGGIDILVNNAGVSGFAAIDADNYEAVWARSFGVLITAQQRLIRAALPHLRKSGRAPDRQHRLHRGPGRHQPRQPLRRRQVGGHRPHAGAGGRARPRGDHRQLHLPGPDPAPA